jgi:hypothetical protein
MAVVSVTAVPPNTAPQDNLETISRGGVIFSVVAAIFSLPFLSFF